MTMGQDTDSEPQVGPQMAAGEPALRAPTKPHVT